MQCRQRRTRGSSQDCWWCLRWIYCFHLLHSCLGRFDAFGIRCRSDSQYFPISLCLPTLVPQEQVVFNLLIPTNKFKKKLHLHYSFLSYILEWRRDGIQFIIIFYGHSRPLVIARSLLSNFSSTVVWYFRIRSSSELRLKLINKIIST